LRNENEAENLQLRDSLRRQADEIRRMSRELEIEAALEEVRSRSLAMHKSDELKEVVNVVFQELRDLNIVMDSACILTFNQSTRGTLHGRPILTCSRRRLLTFLFLKMRSLK